MNKPSEVTKEKMLDALYRNWATNSKRNSKEFKMLQAIRCLIKKFFEWQERADVINVDFLGAPSINLKDAHDLILEIRNFGKEVQNAG